MIRRLPWLLGVIVLIALDQAGVRGFFVLLGAGLAVGLGFTALDVVPTFRDKPDTE